MDNQSNPVESLIDKLKNYVETRIDLAKLKGINKASTILTLLISKVFIIIIAIFFILLASIGLALWLGDLLGKYYYGFFIVSGLYLIAGILVHVFRKSWLRPPIGNMLIKNLLD